MKGLWLACLPALTAPAFAAHPLITDDAGTQGRRRVQVELVGEYARAMNGGTAASTVVGPTMPTLTVGLLDPLDIVTGIAYQKTTVSEDGSRRTSAGATDFALDLKWRFYESGSLSLGLKPGFTLPSGDHEKGLGPGRSTQRLLLIAGQELGAWTVHANAGFTRNANRSGDRESLWHLSGAVSRAVVAGLRGALDLGFDSDTEPGSRRLPAYVLGGLVWSLGKDLDLDLGAKRVFGVPGTAYSIMAGVTIRL